MSDPRQLPLWPDDERDHGQGDRDDDAFPPHSNYLAQFRRPMTEMELAEAAREFEEIIAEWLDEVRRDDP